MENAEGLLERVSEINAGVNKMTSRAFRDSLPKFDTIIAVSFQYELSGRWFSIDASMREYEEMLKSGSLDGRQLATIEVSVTNVGNEDGDKVRMIYDFVKLHTGESPWRML